MVGFDKKDWDDWLKTDNPYAIADIEMIRIDTGRYMNPISGHGQCEISL